MAAPSTFSTRSLLSLLAAVMLVTAAGAADYYATSNPGQTRPPNSPWQQISGTVTIPGGGSVWFARSNVYVQSNKKAFTLTLTSSQGQGFVSFLTSSNANGYYVKSGTTYTSSIISVTNDQYSVGPPPTLTCCRTFQPQPDWEVIKISSSLTTGQHKVDVSMTTHCSQYSANPSGPHLVNDGMFTPPTSMLERYTAVLIYPDVVPLELAFQPIFVAPPHTGEWVWSVAPPQDPWGEPRPFPGIHWETSGVGLHCGEPFHMEFMLMGPSAQTYTAYAFDAEAQAYRRLFLDARPSPDLLGDLNCDGQVNFDDINPFVQLLSDPGGWQQSYPGCPLSNGDTNGDGQVSFTDINPFVGLLSG